MPPSRPGNSGTVLVGVEHEFRVLDERGDIVDFRDIVDGLHLDGCQLDPGDAHAWRLRSGAALTADGMEAEVATPPVEVHAGFAREVVARVEEARAKLKEALPGGWRLEGYSTHISVSAAEGDEERLARTFALTFGLPFAWLAEGPASLGIYVRPRWGRVELCCDFVSGARLEACLAFAAASVAACAAGQATVALGGELLPGIERFGFRLQRTASFGFDTYTGWREQPFPSDGASLAGEAILKSAVECARAFAPGPGGDDWNWLDQVASGNALAGVDGADDGMAAGMNITPAVEGAILGEWVRDGDTWRAKYATWATTVFEASGGDKPRFVTVPRRDLAAFVSLLDGGDGAAEAAGEVGPGGTLTQFEQAQHAGVWDAVDPAALVAPEWPVAGAKDRESPGGVKQRVGKVLAPIAEAPQVPPVVPFVPAPPLLPTRDSLPPPRTQPVEAAPPFSPADQPWWPVVVLGSVVLAAVIVVGVVIAGANDGSGVAEPTATTVRESQTVPAVATLATVATAIVPASSTPQPTETAPATPSATATATATVAAVSTAPVTATGTLPATATPDGGGALVTATATVMPTVRPTETPRPTASATATPTRVPVVDASGVE